MKEIILIKNGELALKGLNRCNFEDILIKNIRRRLKSLGEVTIKKAQSAIYIEPKDESFDFAEALERVKLIFGIAAFSRAYVCEKAERNFELRRKDRKVRRISFIFHMHIFS
jgi:thiamine biosynthesis protein ThiI